MPEKQKITPSRWNKYRALNSPGPIPKTLPDDLYDYGDDPAPRFGAPRGTPLHVVDVEKLPVVDDWPEKVPITEEEIDIFERYFGDVLDRLFGPIDDPDLGLK